jgi:hypothetical protein
MHKIKIGSVLTAFEISTAFVHDGGSPRARIDDPESMVYRFFR